MEEVDGKISQMEDITTTTTANEQNKVILIYNILGC